MASVIKSSKTLSIEAGFKDGDTRTITIKDPISDTTELTTKVKALNTHIKNSNLILGDKAAADFDRFNSAKVSSRTTTYVDVYGDE